MIQMIQTEYTRKLNQMTEEEFKQEQNKLEVERLTAECASSQHVWRKSIELCKCRERIYNEVQKNRGV